MKRILLVGSSGFIGQHLVRFLREEGHELSQSAQRAETFDFQEFLGELAKAEVVINAAGLAHSQAGARAEAEYELVNAQFPERLARAAIASGVSRFIHISSVKAAAYEQGELNTEENCLQPSDVYGRTKRKGEENLQALDWKDSRYTILRPSLVFGAGVKANLHSLLRYMRQPMCPRINGGGARSMVSVYDVSSAVGRCIEYSEHSGVFILAERNSYSLERIQRAVDACLDRRSVRCGMSAEFLLSMARIVDGVSAWPRRTFGIWPEFVPKCQKLTMDELYSGKKFADELGWEPTFGMESVMPEMLEALDKAASTSSGVST